MRVECRMDLFLLLYEVVIVCSSLLLFMMQWLIPLISHSHANIFCDTVHVAKLQARRKQQHLNYSVCVFVCGLCTPRGSCTKDYNIEFKSTCQVCFSTVVREAFTAPQLTTIDTRWTAGLIKSLGGVASWWAVKAYLTTFEKHTLQVDLSSMS